MVEEEEKKYFWDKKEYWIRYPFPELWEVELRACGEILNSKSFQEKCLKAEDGTRPLLEVELKMFLQSWEDENLGFDVKMEPFRELPEYKGKAYTFVFHETLTDTWVVSFFAYPAYVVCEPTLEFLDDLKAEKLVRQSEALKRYHAEL